MAATSTHDETLALVHEGWNHLMSQRPLAAWGTWQRALRLDPDATAARQALETLESGARPSPGGTQGLSLSEAGDRSAAGRGGTASCATAEAAELADAAEAFGRLAAEVPDDAEAWFNRALCLAWAGLDRQAIECLDQVAGLEADERPEEGRGSLDARRDPPPGRRRGEPLRRPALCVHLRLELRADRIVADVVSRNPADSHAA